MIYTVGRKADYDRYLCEQVVCRKLGREGSYCGGSVWRTFEEAQAHAPEGFAVYGLKAEWDTDTVKSGDGDWNDLLVSSEIVNLD